MVLVGKSHFLTFLFYGPRSKNERKTRLSSIESQPKKDVAVVVVVVVVVVFVIIIIIS